MKRVGQSSWIEHLDKESSPLLDTIPKTEYDKKVPDYCTDAV
jgi:hypothetical protein